MGEMKIEGKVAVITGASSGIGRALAVELGLRGAKVVLAARTLARLAETSAILNGYGVENFIIPFDVTAESSIQEFLERVLSACSTIDIFVNNAAVGLFESTAKASTEDIETVFQTNFRGPLATMQRVIPLLNGGTLVNISSAAAKYAPFRQGIYAASKAALERVTEAIGVEEASHMRTLLVIPDRTATPFMNNVVGPRENIKLGLNLKLATAEQVARRIALAIEKDKDICYTTSRSRLYAILSAVAPGLVKRLIRKTSQGPRT